MIRANILQKELEQKVIDFSLQQYGKPYIHGKMGPDSFDCAGLVWYIYFSILNINIFEMGFGLSTTTIIMTSYHGKITLYNQIDNNKIYQLHKGDVLFFHRQSLNDSYPKPDNRYPGHVGIYLGNDYFIQSSNAKGKVVISNFKKDDYWQKGLVGSKNVIVDFISHDNEYSIHKEKSLIGK